MATAGSGDVLTGVIAAFLAQGYRPEHAATLGVYIHGLAGDMAVKEIGEYGLVSSDIANYCGRAIRAIINRESPSSENMKMKFKEFFCGVMLVASAMPVAAQQTKPPDSRET